MDQTLSEKSHFRNLAVYNHIPVPHLLKDNPKSGFRIIKMCKYLDLIKAKNTNSPIFRFFTVGNPGIATIVFY